MALSILYRGPLSSCNYDCGYCPFAKRHETAAELKRDEQALARFTAWVRDEWGSELSILFTPWGEALVRRWYQQALAELSGLAQVRRVAIQTNLSCRLDWLGDCQRDKVNLWCTWHPTQIALDDFLARCRELDACGVRYSVGIVGVHEAFEQIRLARRRLAPEIYLWINAFKDIPDYYTAEEVAFLASIDPYFRTNLANHASLGEHCLAGETAISIDGAGDIRRCHFIAEVIGNLYRPDWRQALQRRTCTRSTCDCHIGYVHLPRLGQRAIYGGGLLARIPQHAVGNLAHHNSPSPSRSRTECGGSIDSAP